jgi:hypothetical protein
MGGSLMSVVPLLLPLLLVQAADPPRAVNRAAPGQAKDYATRGPARVCVGTTMVDLLAGETAYLDYLGIHGGGVRIVGPKGRFSVTDGNLWLRPKHPKLFKDERGRIVERRRRGGRSSYFLYARFGQEQGKERPKVLIEGDALGKGRASAVLARISFAEKKATGCDRAFDYGWETLIGEEGSAQ